MPEYPQLWFDIDIEVQAFLLSGTLKLVNEHDHKLGEIDRRFDPRRCFVSSVGQQIINQLRHAFAGPADDFGGVLILLKAGVGVAERDVKIRAHDC